MGGRTILVDEAEKLVGQGLLPTWFVQLGNIEGFQLYVIHFYRSCQLMYCSRGILYLQSSWVSGGYSYGGRSSVLAGDIVIMFSTQA